jgi:hypothetical protein
MYQNHALKRRKKIKCLYRKSFWVEGNGMIQNTIHNLSLFEENILRSISKTNSGFVVKTREEKQ